MIDYGILQCTNPRVSVSHGANADRKLTTREQTVAMELNAVERNVFDQAMVQYTISKKDSPSPISSQELRVVAGQQFCQTPELTMYYTLPSGLESLQATPYVPGKPYTTKVKCPIQKLTVQDMLSLHNTQMSEVLSHSNSDFCCNKPGAGVDGRGHALNRDAFVPLQRLCEQVVETYNKQLAITQDVDSHKKPTLLIPRFRGVGYRSHMGEITPRNTGACALLGLCINSDKMVTCNDPDSWAEYTTLLSFPHHVSYDEHFGIHSGRAIYALVPYVHAFVMNALGNSFGVENGDIERHSNMRKRLRPHLTSFVHQVKTVCGGNATALTGSASFLLLKHEEEVPLNEMNAPFARSIQDGHIPVSFALVLQHTRCHV